MSGRIWLAVGLILLGTTARATIINVPGDQPTIQAGINAASNGDTVLVQPDTYYENIVWPDVNGIRLISAGDSSNTIIDGGANDRVIYMNPSTATIDSTTAIQGFKITNGGSSGNGGGMFLSSASPVLRRLWVTGNSASQHGGGLYVSGGSPTLTGMTVTDNSATYWGGGGLYIYYGSPTLTNMTVADNTALAGGGLCIRGSGSATLTGMTVTGNTVSYYGGGLYFEGGSPMLTEVTVTGNNASAEGGGIYIDEGTSTLTNVTVSGNSSYYGGGIFVFGEPTLTNVTMTGNTAAYGGGFYLDDGNPALTDVTVTFNAAISGGGLYITYYSAPSLTDMIISSNIATSYGGGLFIEDSDPTLVGVTVTGNIATHYSGGLFISESNPALANVTLTGNTGGIYVESGTPTIAGSNIAYNEAGLHNADNTNTIDADSVWWGDASGPHHPQQNPGGLGDSVNAYVDITPFLTEPDTAAPPIPVQNLAVAGTGNDFISLTWATSPLGDLAGYKVYYDTDSNGFPYADTVDVGVDTAYTLSGLPLGTTHYLAVTCYDTDGNESWYSQEVVATPGDATAPAAPQNLMAEAGDGQVTLIWAKSTENDFLRYRIYGSTSPNPTTPVDSSANIADTAKIIGGLANDTTYYYRVSAVDNSLNESGYSNEVSAMPKDITAPAAPQNLMAEAGDGQVTLIWAKSTESDFLRYRIYGDTTANPATAIDSSESALDTTRTISDLDNGTTYYFRVTAVDTSGNESSFSNEVSATPTALAVEESSGIPASFALHPAYPNPFNPVSTIRYDLPQASNVTLIVYDILGREVAKLVDGYIEPGYHQAVWDGRDITGREVPSGIYIARIVTPEYTKSIKMLLLK